MVSLPQPGLRQAAHWAEVALQDVFAQVPKGTLATRDNAEASPRRQGEADRREGTEAGRVTPAPTPKQDEGEGMNYKWWADACSECGLPLRPRRKGAMTCSTRCRVRRHRRLNGSCNTSTASGRSVTPSVTSPSDRGTLRSPSTSTNVPRSAERGSEVK